MVFGKFNHHCYLRKNSGKTFFMKALHFTPFPVFTTERLTLRQLTLKDEKEILAIRSDKRVAKFLERPLYKTTAEARKFINRINSNIRKNESVYWGITLKNDNKIIGTICLWNIQKEHSRAEIGFELLPHFQGKGIMQEALTIVLDYGFNRMKLHSIEGNVNPGNSSSIKILEKNNFIREAYFKENVFYNGKFRDTAIYSLIR
jgi:RimJ/RimL family protein N-acetyltransferase